MMQSELHGLHRHLRPTPTDGYPSPTAALQTTTENLIKTHIPFPVSQELATSTTPGSSVPGKGPVLQRQLHIQFLLRNLLQGFPQRYISQDASQPWLIFWTLQGFSALGIGLDDRTKTRARQTLLALQHPSGGFAGGPGQAAHLLPTYAAVCSLAIVGQPGKGGGWEEVDRKNMYDFFMSLKQPDGSFLVTHHGEVDVRGLYCLIAVATLLNIATPQLLAGMPEFIASCQTYEGGFGNASFPEWAFQDNGNGVKFNPSALRPVLGEAHGGYTFCAIATWVLLQPYLRLYYPASPSSASVAGSSASHAPSINLHTLMRWLTQMQGTPIELGGFRGRTNKLVDGCYSWWVGVAVVLVEGLLETGTSAGSSAEGRAAATHQEDAWDDVDDSLFNRHALQEYILYAGQHPAGGLRDKPPKPADSYHTLYCLSGLSAAQHRVIPDEVSRAELLGGWQADKARNYEGSTVLSTSESEHLRLDRLRQEQFVNALCWLEDGGTDKYVGGEANRVNATHPLFNLTVTHTEAIMAHFYGQNVPLRKPKAPIRK